jgi:catechol 2,3-dioxygenase-like lactoylglutathione lyase family enzyme
MAKIRHLVFNTTDPERLAKFYVDVMGLEIIHRAKNRAIDPDGNNFDISENGYQDIRAEAAEIEKAR